MNFFSATLVALRARLLNARWFTGGWRFNAHLASHLGNLAALSRLHLARVDFSAVTSIARAQALHSQGKLARMLLLAPVLGGKEAEANTAYVPPDILAVMQRLTATLERYLREGRIDALSIDPEYKGKSLVPARIRVQARKEGRVGAFTTVIGIW